MVALGSTACRGDDDTDVARAEVGPEGGTVVSADSVLTIAILPGALEETIQLTIERSDDPPEVFGPAYAVHPNLDLAVPATVTKKAESADCTAACCSVRCCTTPLISASPNCNRQRTSCRR